MTNQEVLEPLQYFSKDFPRAALKEIQINKDRFTPDLLESLDYAHRNAKELYEERSDYFLHVYAMYLLAEFREKKTFPYLIKFLQLPKEYVDFIIGDTLTESYPKLLLSTYDGENMQMLLDTIENSELNEWGRVAAIRACEFLYLEGFIPEAECVSYLRSLIYEKLSPDDSYVVFTTIIGSIIYTRLFEMIPDARFLYENDRIDPAMYGDYGSFLDFMFDESHSKKAHYVNDAISEMEWWACFETNKKKKDEFVEKDFGDFIVNEVKKDKDLNKMLAQKYKKTGRNDPCPCGSGKKYKKCCYNVHRSGASIIQLEEKYDLLKDYPKDSPRFNQLFEKEAIEIDMLVYKALHHRTIPMWAKRDYEQERIGKIKYLKEALDLFLDKCKREQITSFSDYDERYMVHYQSDDWISALVDMISDEDSYEIVDIKDQSMEILHQFR